MMNKQYCKVGSVTPMDANTDIISLLEYQYQMSNTCFTYSSTVVYSMYVVYDNIYYDIYNNMNCTNPDPSSHHFVTRYDAQNRVPSSVLSGMAHCLPLMCAPYKECKRALSNNRVAI